MYKTIVQIALIITFSVSLNLFKANSATLKGKAIYEGGNIVQGAIPILVYHDLNVPTNKPTSFRVTDSSGTFTFENLQEGNYTLRIFDPKKPLYYRSNFSDFEITSDQIIESTYTLTKGLSVVKVTLRGGNPKNKDRGSFWSSSAQRFSYFDSSTFFIERFPPGKATLEIRVLPYGTTFTTVDIPQDSLVEIIVDISKTNPIKGRLVDENGNGISGAYYFVRNFTNDYTQKDGSFLIPDQIRGSKFSIEIRHNQFTDTAILVPSVLQNNTLTVQLRRAQGWIKGAVKSFKNESLKNCEVLTYRITNLEDHKMRSTQKITKVAANGKFEIKSIDTCKYIIEIRADSLNYFHDTIQSPSDIGTITLYPQTTLEGLIVDDLTGHSIDSFNVSVFNGVLWGRIPYIHKNSKGIFSVPSVREGYNYIGVYSSGYLRSFDSIYVEKGSHPSPKTIRMKKGASLSVKTFFSGKSVSGVKIFFTNSDGMRFLNTTRVTDTAGLFIFNDLPKSRYNLKLYKSGFIPQQFDIDLNSNQSLDVELKKGEIISGILLDNSGNPVNNLRIAAKQDLRFSNEHMSIEPHDITISSGKFDFNELLPGTYSLLIALPWSIKQAWVPVMRFDNITTGTSNLTLQLPPSRQWIIRPLLSGKPVFNKNCRIAIMIPPQDDTLGVSGSKTLGSIDLNSEFTGDYEFKAYTGINYIVYLEGDGLAPTNTFVKIPTGSSTYITTIELNKSPFFSGKVIHFDSSENLSRYRVSALKKSEPDAMRLPEPFKAECDKRGNFTLSSVPVGQFPVIIKSINGKIYYAGLHSPTNGSSPSNILIQRPGYLKVFIDGIKNLRDSERVLRIFLPHANDYTIDRLMLSNSSSETVDLPPCNYLISSLDKTIQRFFEIKQGETTKIYINIKSPPVNVSVRAIPSMTGSYKVLNCFTKNLKILDSTSSNNSNFLFDEAPLYPGNYLIKSSQYTIIPGKVILYDTLLQINKVARIKSQLTPAQGSIFLNVVTQKGLPVQGAVVFLRKHNATAESEIQNLWQSDDSSNLFLVKQPLDNRGSLQINGLRNGSYLLSIFHPHLSSKSFAFKIDSTENHNLTITMENGTPIKNDVLFKNFRINNYTLWIFDSANIAIGAINHNQWKEGNNSLNFSLPPGNYSLLTTHYNLASSQVQRISVGNSIINTSFELKGGAWISIDSAKTENCEYFLTNVKNETFYCQKRSRTYYQFEPYSDLSTMVIGPIEEGEYIIKKSEKDLGRKLSVKAGKFSSIIY